MFNIFNLFKGIFSKNKKGALYICQNCRATEIIPYRVLEEFDHINPEQLLYGPHTFRCEKCNAGIMHPEHYEAMVMGLGLYDGLNYTIKTTTPTASATPYAPESNKKHKKRR